MRDKKAIQDYKFDHGSCLDVEIWFIERKMYDYKT